MLVKNEPNCVSVCLVMSFTEAQLQAILAESLKTALSAVGNIQDGGAKPRVKAPERPPVDLGSSETQWAFFLDEWGLYKRRASLKPEHLTDELRACCYGVTEKTFRSFGQLATNVR